jgi:hypothetical protein
MTLKRLVVLAIALLVLAGSTSQAAFAGPGVPAWKMLMTDAYSGRIHGEYSCATVQQAVRHLPPVRPLLNPIERILRAYAKRICRRAVSVPAFFDTRASSGT